MTQLGISSATRLYRFHLSDIPWYHLKVWCSFTFFSLFFKEVFSAHQGSTQLNKNIVETVLKNNITI